MSNNYIINYIITILLIFIIVMGIIIWLKNREVKEGFMPAIHQMYRPYLRRGRIYTNNMANYVTSRGMKLFKKIGLL